MTNKGFSLASLVAYGNGCINNTKGNTPAIQTAFKTDLKKAIAHAGYPSKDEIGIVDTINDFDMSATMEQIPNIVAGYMKDEQRSFAIPAGDKNSTPCTVSVVHVDKKTTTGVNQFGPNAGKEYTSVCEEHEEYKVKNNRKAFKK